VLPNMSPGRARIWARTKQILDALEREPTPSNYAAVSKALERLRKRGLIVAARAEIGLPGKGYLYAKKKL
jgi:hypothetical protein